MLLPAKSNIIIIPLVRFNGHTTNIRDLKINLCSHERKVNAMPELPEVETVKRVLEPQIRGLTVTKVTVKRPEITAYPDAEQFCRLVTGQTLSHMERRGKFLILHLRSHDRIILHLRMTGCLLLAPADFPEEAHTHIIFSLSGSPEELPGSDNAPASENTSVSNDLPASDNVSVLNGLPASETVSVSNNLHALELRFSDMRRFGRFWLIRENEEDPYSGIGKLGIEPFDDKLTPAYLAARLGKRRKTVKECLLDQSVIAGIGNIYSDEILFSAGIYPARPANSLKQEDWERIAAAVPERLAFFTEKNEITWEDYLQAKGRNYRNTPFFQVYGRSGQPCPACNHRLCRMVVGGRSSVYCPDCQKDPGA